jgi:hypothetical protein
MTLEQHLHFLTTHRDPAVVRSAQVVAESIQRRNRILNMIQEAISQLRLDMKYMLFDLWATRRERDALKK